MGCSTAIEPRPLPPPSDEGSVRGGRSARLRKEPLPATAAGPQVVGDEAPRAAPRAARVGRLGEPPAAAARQVRGEERQRLREDRPVPQDAAVAEARGRSEEHTSELQSRENL